MKSVCKNPACRAPLNDDEADFRDGLCYECWLVKCREADSE